MWGLLIRIVVITILHLNRKKTPVFTILPYRRKQHKLMPVLSLFLNGGLVGGILKLSFAGLSNTITNAIDNSFYPTNFFFFFKNIKSLL